MFSFNFSKENLDDDVHKIPKLESKLQWYTAKKIEISDQENSVIDYVENNLISGFSLKMVRVDKLSLKCKDIIQAESEHSDLVPTKYEGGLKIWECTYDLANYLLKQEIDFKDKRVLDLGCGVGVLGLLTLLKGSLVHFQDYNAEVIEAVTIPSILLNCCDPNIIKEKCEFYSGDWETFAELLANNKDCTRYDYILTSETIYNPDNYEKMKRVLKTMLSKDGICFLAAKTYYFGVGGSLRQFENILSKDGCFSTKIVWKSEEGLQREILKIQQCAQGDNLS